MPIKNLGDAESPPPMPVFSLWWRDFFASSRVQELCGVQRALYLLLLALEWAAQGKGLPADPRRLCALLGVDEETYENLKSDVLDEFFECRNGRLFNGRLESELERARDLKSKRRIAGRKGAKATNKLSGKTPAKGSANRSAN